MEKNVFIIEDNDQNVKLYKAIFNTISDIKLFFEARGDKGLEMIKAGDPDLIILDNKLPGLGGIEICKEVRKIEKFKEIPIIAVSSSPIVGNREKTFSEAGFSIILSKPINIREFRKAIKNILA